MNSKRTLSLLLLAACFVTSPAFAFESAALAPKEIICRCKCEQPDGTVLWSEDSEYTDDCSDPSGQSCESSDGSEWGVLSCYGTWVPSEDETSAFIRELFSPL